MPSRRSEPIEDSWVYGYCPECGEEFDDGCECLFGDDIKDDDNDDPPEPEDDNEANWAGDTSEKNAH